MDNACPHLMSDQGPLKTPGSGQLTPAQRQQHQPFMLQAQPINYPMSLAESSQARTSRAEAGNFVRERFGDQGPVRIGDAKINQVCSTKWNNSESFRAKADASRSMLIRLTFRVPLSMSDR